MKITIWWHLTSLMNTVQYIIPLSQLGSLPIFLPSTPLSTLSFSDSHPLSSAVVVSFIPVQVPSWFLFLILDSWCRFTLLSHSRFWLLTFLLPFFELSTQVETILHPESTSLYSGVLIPDPWEGKIWWKPGPGSVPGSGFSSSETGITASERKLNFHSHKTWRLQYDGT